MININRARTVARLHLDNGMVVSEADAKLICQALLALKQEGVDERAEQDKSRIGICTPPIDQATQKGDGREATLPNQEARLL